MESDGKRRRSRFLKTRVVTKMLVNCVNKDNKRGANVSFLSVIQLCVVLYYGFMSSLVDVKEVSVAARCRIKDKRMDASRVRERQ